MNGEKLYRKLQQKFPKWKIEFHDVPDMTSGINITTLTGGKFDVKIINKDKVLVDYDFDNANQEDAESIIEFIGFYFKSVEQRHLAKISLSTPFGKASTTNFKRPSIITDSRTIIEDMII